MIDLGKQWPLNISFFGDKCKCLGIANLDATESRTQPYWAHNDTFAAPQNILLRLLQVLLKSLFFYAPSKEKGQTVFHRAFLCVLHALFLLANCDKNLILSIKTVFVGMSYENVYFHSVAFTIRLPLGIYSPTFIFQCPINSFDILDPDIVNKD